MPWGGATLKSLGSLHRFPRAGGPVRFCLSSFPLATLQTTSSAKPCECTGGMPGLCSYDGNGIPCVGVRLTQPRKAGEKTQKIILRCQGDGSVLKSTHYSGRALGSPPSSHKGPHRHFSFQFQGMGRSLLTSAEIVCTWYTDINAGETL